MNNIKEALLKRFESHRIIFWYDEKKELIEQYEELSIDGVDKIYVQGNEFEVKYRISKQERNNKFLLYFTGKKPLNEENWLLDLVLAHHVFHTDQEAMFMQEIGMGYHFKELVAEHIEFFKSKGRRTKLKELLGEGDQHEDIRGKMLAVLFNTDYVNLSTFIQAHSSEFIDGNDKFDKNLDRYNLSNYYWGRIKHQFNYLNEAPSIYDFLLEVFNHNFILGSKNTLNKESRILLLQWKDTIQFRDSFAQISEKIAKDLDIKSKLNETTLDTIIDDDLFELVDLKVIHELVTQLAEGSITTEKVLKYIKKRENKFWNNKFQPFYSCITYGAQFVDKAKETSSTTYKSFDEGVKNYSENLYEVDFIYRKFIWNFRQTKQNKILAHLVETVEKIYSNDWLLNNNNNWQKVIENVEVWPFKKGNSQRAFFKNHVVPFIEKKQRLFVIISDAFRYECGAELSERLQAENRYESSIDSMVASLPSYTQLGMASLLPHKEISFKEGSDSAEVDGMSSSGTQGRAKILATNSGVRATAIKAKDFMNFNSATEGRDFVKKHDLIYIYHNRIDKMGDDKTTEENVFEAVEDELDFLMDMLKKIANMNGNNMLITSDHGFIYQNNSLDESDFVQSNHNGTIWKENRRFVIGEGLKGDNTTTAFTASQLGLKSDSNVLIPKSINRLRIKGAGSRFVHGGASLQEIIIPVIKVTKKRQNTTSQVEIDIIKSTDRITTNILPVSFIQSDLVTEKVLARTLRAGIYAEDGELLSDQFKYNFDIEQGSERQREVKHRFQLMAKASGKYKNQRVQFILEEPVEGTTKWKQYKEYYYTLNISFTNDFDDF
ncbi:BREX-1 system phosphatase PglZ type A [Lutibacter flavus]|uniref:TIGR02687 family protein n=1 Tax=Lutibacter flavus TaxID=691689 RepID=A0A238VHS4_9FLAO|nr:BREX-1 system phosphatase PglZ type A [Lutibacter flavus]SNR33945.1 TIGR02687 family protein [Lutibacter flavus]